jgi:hypothetical protein
MNELLIRLLDGIIMFVMIAAYTSALVDYCKTPPKDMPRLGRIPRLP